MGTDFERTTITVYDALGRVLRTVDNYVPQGSPATDPADWVWNANAAPPCWERGENDATAIEHGTDDTQNIIADTAYNKLGLVKFRRDVWAVWCSTGTTTPDGWSRLSRMQPRRTTITTSPAVCQ